MTRYIRQMEVRRLLRALDRLDQRQRETLTRVIENQDDITRRWIDGYLCALSDIRTELKL